MFEKIATIKFDIQKFDGHINFGMWKVRMMVVLTQQNLNIELFEKGKKPSTMKDFEWNNIDDKTFFTFQLYINNDVLQEVL